MTESQESSSAAAANPLREFQERHGAIFLDYGSPTPEGKIVTVVESFGEYEAEYAAIRKGVGILHAPQRGVVELQGADRLEFLHRMLTNDTRTLKPGEARRAFLLGKTGRIVADMIVIHEDQRTLLVLDLFQAATLPAELEKYLFTEDVKLADRSGAYAQLALHGPAGAALLEAAGGAVFDPEAQTRRENAGMGDLQPMHHRAVVLKGHACAVYRRDETGAPGLHLIVPREEALAIYEALAQTVGGLTPLVEGGVIRPIRGRGIGWAAYNTARIEGGTPLFHIDFGPDSLPHETGVLSTAVSFTKGCYLGQEIVARMQNLGHPKRVLVGLRFDDDRMPIAGAQVMAPPPEAPPPSEGLPSPDVSRPMEKDGTAAVKRPAMGNSGQIVGAMTSSTLSPLLGGVAIGFAVVKWGVHQPGTVLCVPAEGEIVPARVRELSFLPAPVGKS